MNEQLERIDGMGDARLVPTAQAATVAAGVRETAELRGQLVLAREFPRDELQARAGALESCGRPEFCMKADGDPKAIYSYKRGKAVVSGPGVVLARELARRWGNLRYGIQELPDEDQRMVHLRAQAMDLETNAQTYAEDRFRKAIQRKPDRDSPAVWVDTDDERDLRELKNKRGALLTRNCLLQLLPPDLVDLAVARVRETMALAAGGDLIKDRKGTVLKLTATFSKLGVVRAQLDTFLGASLDEVTAEQLADLKGAYVAITDGASSVGALFPPLESDGAAALRARIAELEAKVVPPAEPADPFGAATRTPAADPSPTADPEPDAAATATQANLAFADSLGAPERQPGDDDE